jgi:GT2 family glycosyltransferase
MAGIEGAVTVVDNASGDGSAERLRAGVAGMDRVQVIDSPRNGGFGAGMNVGIRAGLPDGRLPDFVYLLNSDAFPAPDAIARLLDHLARHPEAGIAGSHIHGPDGAPHVTAFRFPSLPGEFEGAARLGPVSRLLARWAVALPVPDRSRPVDWLAGASMMLRRTMLDTVGLFDERFFLYFEETDLCLRARQAGWQTHYVADSRVAHLGSASTGMKDWGRMPEYWFDSRLHYFTKHHGRPAALTATALHVTGGALWRLRRRVERKPNTDPPRMLRDMIAHARRWRPDGRQPHPPIPASPIERTEP